jgi:hypothetical protein
MSVRAETHKNVFTHVADTKNVCVNVPEMLTRALVGVHVNVSRYK